MERGLSPYNYGCHGRNGYKMRVLTSSGFRFPVSPLLIWFTTWAVDRGLVVGKLQSLVDSAVPIYMSYFR